MSLSEVTPEGAIYALAVFMVMVGAYNAIMTAREKHHARKKEQEAPNARQDEQIVAINSKLDNDNRRLNRHDNELEDLQTGMRVLLRSNMAINSHLLNSNSKDKLIASNTEIQNYLVDRK